MKNQLKEIREHQRISISTLARVTGISYRRTYYLDNMRTKYLSDLVSYTELSLIAKCFKCSIEDILTDEDKLQFRNRLESVEELSIVE